MGRRGVTTAVTMLVLCLLLVVAAIWGWRWLFADLPEGTSATPAAEPTPSCTTEDVDAGQRVRARQVRVSVFNGGTRSGLAGETMDALEQRGFRAGEVGNAPSDVAVRRVQVWSTSENDAEARLVALQFGKQVDVEVTETDLGPGVDVIVGDRFRTLKKAKRSVEVRQPQEVCVPSAGEEGTAS